MTTKIAQQFEDAKTDEEFDLSSRIDLKELAPRHLSPSRLLCVWCCINSL